jgi:hypothetical protein
MPKTNIKGVYELCFDNSYSHINSKLVSIYILSFHSDALMKKYEHEKELNETTTKVRSSVDKISINLIEIFTHQAMARFKQTRDDHTLDANHSLVLHWSIFQMILICTSSLVQAYFIKRLFSQNSTSSKIKFFT